MRKLYVYIFLIFIGIILCPFLNNINNFSIGIQTSLYRITKIDGIYDIIRAGSYSHDVGGAANLEDIWMGELERSDFEDIHRYLHMDDNRYNNPLEQLHYQHLFNTCELNLDVIPDNELDVFDDGALFDFDQNILDSQDNDPEKTHIDQSIHDMRADGFSNSSIYNAIRKEGKDYFDTDTYEQITLDDIKEMYEGKTYVEYSKNSDGKIIDGDGNTTDKSWKLPDDYTMLYIEDSSGTTHDFLTNTMTGNSYSNIHNGKNHFLIFNHNILVARVLIGHTLSESSSLIQDIALIEGSDEVKEARIKDAIDNFFKNVGNEVVTSFPPGNSIILNYNNGAIGGVLQLIKDIFPDFQFGGSPTEEASGYWKCFIDKYLGHISEPDNPSINIFWAFNKSEKKEDLEKNANYRELLKLYIKNPDDIILQEISENDTINDLRISHKIVKFLPTYRNGEITKDEFLRIFLDERLYNPNNEENIINKLQDFQIHYLIERYNELLLSGLDNDFLNIIRNALKNLSNFNLRILSLLNPNLFRNYIENERCDSDFCASSVSFDMNLEFNQEAGAALAIEGDIQAQRRVRQCLGFDKI